MALSPDPLDPGMANSSSGKEDPMDWEHTSTTEQRAVPVSQVHQSREQNRSQELEKLLKHWDWMANFMDKVKSGIESFQKSDGTMDISELFENIDQVLAEGAALKDNTYRLWKPPNNETAEPTNRASATRINPRPETLTLPPQNENNTDSESSQQGATGPKEPNSDTQFINSDETSAVLPLSQSTHEQETELDTLQRRGEFVTNLKSFNTSMPQHAISSPLSTPQNHRHLTSRTTRSADIPDTASQAGGPTYQGAPYIHQPMEDLDVVTELQGIYTDGPPAAAVATTSAGQSTTAGNQARSQLHPSTFTSSSFLGSISQGPLQNWTVNSPWGKVPVWDIRNTRYNKQTSFKLAQELHSLSASIGVIVKNDHLWGTCARYGPRHVMTCQHVVSQDFANLDDPSDAFVEFNYYNEWPPQPSVQIPIQCIDYNCRNSSLDFCLLLLNIQDSQFNIQDVQRLTPGLGPKVMPPGRKVEKVTLIGHPNASPKRFDPNCPVLDWYQSAQYTGQISNTDDSLISNSNTDDSLVFHADRINYRSTFWCGGSGSPMVATCNDNLQIAAMHTQGFPTGQPCEVEQGVKMSAIRAELKTHCPNLYKELFP